MLRVTDLEVPTTALPALTLPEHIARHDTTHAGGPRQLNAGADQLAARLGTVTLDGPAGAGVFDGIHVTLHMNRTTNDFYFTCQKICYLSENCQNRNQAMSTGSSGRPHCTSGGLWLCRVPYQAGRCRDPLTQGRGSREEAQRSLSQRVECQCHHPPPAGRKGKTVQCQLCFNSSWQRQRTG